MNPPLTPAYDKVTIPYGNFYGSDTWRITPRFTLTYGLGWTLEMPPNGNDRQASYRCWPGQQTDQHGAIPECPRKAALQGNVYNPQVGFSLIGNVASHPSYIYNPFYGEWSPRLAAAWDVFGDGRTVIRGGYGRTYGRLNGVDLVLVPLLGHRFDPGYAMHQCSGDRNLWRHAAPRIPTPHSASARMVW